MICKTIQAQGKTYLVFFCPGCQHNHSVPVEPTPNGAGIWGWNGSLEALTITPSIRNSIQNPETEEWQTVCHLFVRDGQIVYCDDNPHQLNGKTIPMVELQRED